MNTFLNLLNKLFIFEKEPQKVGLSQFKKGSEIKKTQVSIKSKDIKLSDLMRHAS